MKSQYYLEYVFKIRPIEIWRDLIISDLGSIGFESFEETDEGFKAYIKEDSQEIKLDEVFENYKDQVEISFLVNRILEENWNKIWEESFDPVIIDNTCIIRASFHTTEKEYPYEIVLNPKMSFGTGHHQTTNMMVRALLKQDVEGKRVLDMGSGTGVLAILASKMKAKSVVAIDIEDWAYENCLENIQLNQTPNVEVLKGNVSLLTGQSFNVILANINKNVLLEDVEHYVKSLQPKGVLIISGFFEGDRNDLIQVAEQFGLNLFDSLTLEKWAALIFNK